MGSSLQVLRHSTGVHPARRHHFPGQDSRKTKRSLPKHCITSFGIGTDGRWLHLTNWRVKAGQELVLARNPHVLASTESVGSRVLCVAHNLVMAPKIPST
jgi:hypothetical protein